MAITNKITMEKSLPLAIGLNLLIPGLGYMYMGRLFLGILGCLVIIGIILISSEFVVASWLMLNIFMAIDMIVLSNKNKKAVLNNTTKKCPRCAETIQKEARVCRFCTAEFEQCGA